MSARLRIGSTLYTLETLATAIASETASENTRATLEFCRVWLSGAPSFTLHTSGSTGPPKPVVLSRAQMEASARATAAALDLRPGMRSLVCLPTRFVAGCMMLVRGLVVGMEMVLAEPAAYPLDTSARPCAIDFASFVPLQLQAILDGPESGRACLDAMHTVLVGGAPLSAALQRALQEIAAPIFHTYGMTETATHVALRRLSGPNPAEAYAPLPGVETSVDGRGCLAVRGPMTNGVWVQTNDVVKRRADGSFVWRGRADNVINSGGVKVQVEPLEAALEPLLPALLAEAWAGQRFFVAGLPDARLGQTVALLIEGPPLPEGLEANLLAELRRALGPFEAPRRVLSLPRFAETATGKIDRRATLASSAHEPLTNPR